MTNYDYTPVPSYVAPTQGNMQQAATEIANWLRTKGNGKDTRESLAQAVQLFGDVAAQFINETSGLKGQFNSAIENVTSDTEVQSARTSTVSGTGYTTLGARLDAIDTEQKVHDTKLNSSVVDTSTNQDVGGIKNYLNYPTFQGGRQFMPCEDTGWLQDGLTYGANVQSVDNVSYRLINLGNMRIMFFGIDFTIKKELLTSAWGTAGREVFALPNGYNFAFDRNRVQRWQTKGQNSLIFRQYNNAVYYDIDYTNGTAGTYSDGSTISLFGQAILNDVGS